MKKLFLSLLLSLTFVASAFAQDSTSPYYSANTFDLIGDSRTADIFVSLPCNGNPSVQCGLQGTNWFAQASALAGQRYQLGAMQALSGCRTDQYLLPGNLRPLVTSKSQYAVIGYSAVNDLGAAGNTCALQPSASAGYPYVNVNGVTVTPSNVANVAAGNVLGAVRQLTGAGKKVILLKEPGNTAINNTPITVSSFTGSTSGTVLTVTAVTSGIIYTPQTVTPGTLIPGTTGLFSAAIANPGSAQLAGSGVSAGTSIVAQLTGSDGSPCPATSASVATSTCTGGVGTYSINISQTITSQTFTGTYSTIAALYDYNSNLDAIGAAFPGSVLVVNNNPALWNFTGSATAVTFKPGVLIDGSTHYSVLGGYYGAVSFNAAAQSFIGGTDVNLASIDDTSTSNLRSLTQNPLFQTATGGVNTNCTLSSGTVPSGWRAVCQNSVGTITITQATDTNQLYGSAAVPIAGNAVTIAITTTGAEIFTFRNEVPTLNGWNLTDYLQAGAVVNVAASSSHCTVYADNQIATNAGTVDSYDLYGGAVPTGGGANDGPTTAYTYTLRTKPATTVPGSVSKSFNSFRIIASFSAAGSCTITVSRPYVNRVRVYNPATGTFSGWLLMRDLDPAANDNYPAGLLKAG